MARVRLVSGQYYYELCFDGFTVQCQLEHFEKMAINVWPLGLYRFV